MGIKKFVIILFSITAVLGNFGITNRGSFTDLTSREDYLSLLSVAELSGGFAKAEVTALKEELPSCRYIFSAVPAGDLESTFHTCRQKIHIKQVFEGGIMPGDEAYVTTERWSIDLDVDAPVRSISRGFVNILQPDKEYLIFCNEKITQGDDIPVYRLYEGTVIAPVFCYEEIENVIVPPMDGESFYVPYEQVKENEFFGCDEEALDAWNDLKGTMLQLYSQA
jgi:hypothetical protein